MGVTVGAATGLLAALLVYFWGGNPTLGWVVFAAMVISVAVAGLVGAAVPLALKATGQDPALGSSVIVTTFTDAFGFLSFLGIATLFLDRIS